MIRKALSCLGPFDEGSAFWESLVSSFLLGSLGAWYLDEIVLLSKDRLSRYLLRRVADSPGIASPENSVAGAFRTTSK